MNIEEFKELYVTNLKREQIYSEFDDYFKTVKEYLSPYVLIVYGSFITDKENPNDIDILLHGFVKNEKITTFNIKMVRSRGLVHVKSEVSALKKETILKSIDELIEWFEEGEKNKTKGIKVNNYMQIDF